MRLVRWFVAIAIIAGICWLFPLFHVVRLEMVDTGEVATTFNASWFAETFWTNQLLPSLDKTVKGDALLAAIQSDAAAARKKFSHSIGLGESYFYFLSGSGRVVAISDEEVSLAVTDGSTNAE